MTELLSQYPPKTTFMKNENNLISAKKPHRSKMKLYFSKNLFLFISQKNRKQKTSLFLLSFQRNY